MGCCSYSDFLRTWFYVCLRLLGVYQVLYQACGGRVMSLVPNNSLKYRSDYPGDRSCADCDNCICKEQIRADERAKVREAIELIDGEFYIGTPDSISRREVLRKIDELSD